MTYKEFRMKAELSGINPIPENVFSKFGEIGLERELLASLLWDDESKGPSRSLSLDSVFSIVISHIVIAERDIENRWMESIGVTDINLTGIDRIKDGAFRNCNSLTSVAIPDGVTSIGDWVFYGCSGLTSVTIPDGVTSIGNESFAYCSGLTGITIPSGVTKIGDFAFYSCRGLTSVTIPDSVTKIGILAFHMCTNVANMRIPNDVTSIGDYAFSGCKNIKEVIFSGRTEDEVKSMESYPWGLERICRSSDTPDGYRMLIEHG